jgi:phospholipase/carboxylesterase
MAGAMQLAPLETFVIEPSAPQRGTVIWLHGLGASNHDFDDVIPELGCPQLRFVFPAAPRLPVTINGGMVMPAWYDILSFDDPPLREHEPTVRTSAEALDALLDAEVARGTPAHDIVLMGFSQGGAMALHVGCRYRESLAGIGVLSGYLLLPDQFDAERSLANSKTHILFGHGTLDPTVPLELGRRAEQRVAAAGHPTEWRTYPIAHSLCLEEVQALSGWLRERLGANRTKPDATAVRPPD